MTLQNLSGASLEPVEPNKQFLSRLLAAADRNIQDANVAQLSPETRFDAAYKAIMQLAMAALHANGWRTLSSKPGHHQTVIQSLHHTIGLAHDSLWPLDALRKQRNLADYSGDLIPESAVTACMENASMLRIQVHDWLQKNRASLLK